MNNTAMAAAVMHAAMAPTIVQLIITMERVKLSKHAKQVFRLLDKGVGHRPADMNPREYNLGALELEELGFAKCYRNTGCDDVSMAHLVKKGRRYMAGNPTLRNPIAYWGLCAKVVPHAPPLNNSGQPQHLNTSTIQGTSTPPQKKFSPKW